MSIHPEIMDVQVYNLNVSGSDTPDITGNDTYVVDNDGGWTTLQIGGFTYTRSSASYSSSSSLNQRTWTWSNTSNPFGTTRGATRNIEIT